MESNGVDIADIWVIVLLNLIILVMLVGLVIYFFLCLRHHYQETKDLVAVKRVLDEDSKKQQVKVERAAHEVTEARKSGPFGVLVAAALLIGGFYGMAHNRPTTTALNNPSASVVGVKSQPAPPGLSLTEKGWEKMRTYCWTDAIPLLEAAADKGGDPETTIGAVAECYFNIRDFEKAVGACDRLLRADPTCGRSYYVRGLVHYQRKEYNEAYRLFREAGRRGDTLALTLIPDKA